MSGRSFHDFRQLCVVTDDEGRLVAVILRVAPRRLQVAHVLDADPTITIYGLCNGEWPRIGDYVMAPRQARCAFHIVEEPKARRTGELALRVERVALPLPPGARRVHGWRWDSRGKNTGSIVPGAIGAPRKAG